ncbi:HYR domain-containing protein [Winogradskyella sp.]|uniref:HYR domain-containing protein n=1 Tax=Winogradskyella sp. TaxID=1883156 RepID=UPI003BAA60BA
MKLNGNHIVKSFLKALNLKGIMAVLVVLCSAFNYAPEANGDLSHRSFDNETAETIGFSNFDSKLTKPMSSIAKAMPMPSITCPSDITVSCPQSVTYNSPTTSSTIGFPVVPSSVLGFTLLGTFGNSTYFLSNVAMTGPQTFAMAQANNYDLVTINSLEENLQLMALLGSTPIYIGLNDLQTDGSFVWQSGQPSFLELSYGMGPNDYVFFLNGNWIDFSGTALFQTVIEFHDYSGGQPIQVTGLPSGSFIDAGTTVTNTFFSKDIMGNSNTCTQSITVNDTEAPSITCPADRIVDKDPGQCSATISIPQPVFSDNCLSATITNDFNNTSDASGTYPLGSTIVTWTATDAAGNENTCIQTITVNDAEVPTITCTPDISTNVDSGLCTATITVPAPSFSDNCPNTTITNDFNNTSDASGSYPVGATSVVWTVRDAAGNENTCTQTITVNDAEAPTITCASDISTDVDSGLCTAMITVPAPTFSDNCPNATITNDFNNTVDASGIYSEGTTTVIWTVRDATGNENTCTQTITVNDTESPTISCPAAVTISCPQVVNYSAPTTSDNCGFLAVPNAIPNTILLGTFGNSTYFVDTRDLQTSLAFTTGEASAYDLVTINSSEENVFLSQQAANLGITTPLLLGYNDINTEGTFVWQSGQAATYESWEPGDPSGGVIDEDYVLAFNGEWFDITGNSLARIVYEVHDYSAGPIQVTGLPSGSLVSSTTTNTFFSKDLAGNINTCSQTITVNDTESPTISCSADINVNTDSGICSATVTVPAPTFSDNCPNVTITNDFNDTSDASGSYPVGSTMVRWTATDASGNTTSCTQEVIVNDQELPSITCPDDIAVNVDAITCTDARVTVPAPTFSDNCPNATITNDFNNTADASGTYPSGTTVVIWTVRDAAGNENTCTQNITVNDIEPPTISCSADINTNVDSGLCTAMVTVPAPTTSDNCSNVTITNDFNNTANASGTYPTGVTTITWTATDASGNSGQCTQQITVTASAPAINCPSDITVACPQTVNYANPTISGVCNFPVVPTSVPGFTVLGTFGNSTYFISNTPMQGSAAFAMAQTNNYDLVTINSLAENQQLASLLGSTTVFIGYNDVQTEGTFAWQSGQPHSFESWAPGQPSSFFASRLDYVSFTSGLWYTDFFSTTYRVLLEFHDYSIGQPIQVSGLPSGSVIGTTTTNSFFAEDVFGNTYNCSFDITVDDTAALVMSCASDVSVSAANACNTSVTVPAPSITYPCSYLLSNDFTNTADASGTYPVGTTLVTWTATDLAGGNSVSCLQRVIVTSTETEAPTMTCPENMTLSCPQVVNYTSPTTADNCGFPIVPTSVSGFNLLGTFGDSTYFISDTAMTGPEAFAMATANDYDLVTINSLAENDQLRALINNTTRVFIGYNDIQTEGTFVWQSGQPNNFENWAVAHPSNASGAHDYVVFLDGFWFDELNTEQAFTVIEFHDYSSGRPIQVTGLPSGAVFSNTTTNTFYSRDTSGNTNTCALTVTITGTTTFSCSSDIVVSADTNACNANVNVSAPTLVNASCGASLIPTTFKVPYNFVVSDRSRTLVDTPAVLPNLLTATNDVVLRVTFSGDHNDGQTLEDFRLLGPDNIELLDYISSASCTVTERLVTVPMATWNSWISTYGSDLTFTLPANASVDKDVCDKNSNFFQIDAISLGDVILTNNHTGTSDASGIYPLGTTPVTWTFTDLRGFGDTCVQTVTVTESETPNISCPANITVDVDSGLCTAVVNYSLPTVTDNCTPFTNTLQNVLDNFNKQNQQLTSLIPNAFNFNMDGTNGVNGNAIADGGILSDIAGGLDMYDGGNRIGTNLNAGPINYSDNVITASTAFGSNGAYVTRKVEDMWLLAADLDNVNSFDITGDLGANSEGLANGFSSLISVNGNSYHLFVKRVRDKVEPPFFERDPSVNHLIIIPENTNATQNFSTDTNSDQHQVTGLSGTNRLYYLLFASDNSGLVDNTAMETIAMSFISNILTTSGTLQQTAGLASGSAFPVGTTTNTFMATDVSGNQSACSFTVTVNDPLGNCTVLVSPKVYLQGSTINSTIATDGLMRDDLRVGNYIPLNTPYTDNTSINSSVLNVTGANAIVDWVWVELRDATTNTTIIEAKSALLQRDGDVVGLDGTSALLLNQPPGNYYIAIKHRNHLGIMSNSAISLNGTTTTVVDFSNGSTTTFGSNAQTTLGLPNGSFAMWVGDVNGDDIILYVGGLQDTSRILSEVLNDSGNILNLPTYVSNGYSNGDIDMNGDIQYAGGNAEPPFILQNVLGNPSNFLNLSTWPVNAQLPSTLSKAMQLRNQFEHSKH